MTGNTGLPERFRESLPRRRYYDELSPVDDGDAAPSAASEGVGDESSLYYYHAIEYNAMKYHVVGLFSDAAAGRRTPYHDGHVYRRHLLPTSASLPALYFHLPRMISHRRPFSRRRARLAMMSY